MDLEVGVGGEVRLIIIANFFFSMKAMDGHVRKFVSMAVRGSLAVIGGLAIKVLDPYRLRDQACSGYTLLLSTLYLLYKLYKRMQSHMIIWG